MISNRVADTLTWKEREKFHQLSPGANLILVRLPKEIWQIGGLNLTAIGLTLAPSTRKAYTTGGQQ